MLVGFLGLVQHGCKAFKTEPRNPGTLAPWNPGTLGTWDPYYWYKVYKLDAGTGRHCPQAATS